MSDFVVSLIRTWTPIAVGAVVSWLVAAQVLDPDAAAGAEEGLIIAGTAIIQGAYYLIVRGLAAKWPSLGVLLGVNRSPNY